jgi:hypothetical protein
MKCFRTPHPSTARHVDKPRAIDTQRDPDVTIRFWGAIRIDA